MGSFPTRTLQPSSEVIETSSSEEETANIWRKKRKIVPSIHVSTPTYRRRAAFIKPEKANSTSNRVDKTKLWVFWKPTRRFSWPNVNTMEARNEQFLND